MNKYLISTDITYRVPTVGDALALREELSATPYCNLTKFSYRTRYIKEKGEIVEEYQVVKATIDFNDEKDPDNVIADIDFVLPDVRVEF